MGSIGTAYSTNAGDIIYRFSGDSTSADGWSFQNQVENDRIEQFFLRYSNVDKLISDMTEDQKAAFKIWTDGDLSTSSVLNDWNALDDLDRNVFRNLDSVLDKATLNKGIEVVSFSNPQILLEKGQSISQLKNMEGKDVTIRSYMSFSAANSGLHIGRENSSEEKQVEYRMEIPGGKISTGAGMWVGDSRINRWNNTQREFLTNRDISVHVSKVFYDVSKDKYVVTLKYLTRLPHDYGK